MNKIEVDEREYQFLVNSFMGVTVSSIPQTTEEKAATIATVVDQTLNKITSYRSDRFSLREKLFTTSIVSKFLEQFPDEVLDLINEQKKEKASKIA